MGCASSAVEVVKSHFKEPDVLTAEEVRQK